MGCDIKNPPVFLLQYTEGVNDWIGTLLWGAYEVLDDLLGRKLEKI
jgi:hypothetical protein